MLSFQVIDEYERAKSLYGDTDSEIFQKYLEEIEKGISVLKTQLTQKLREEDLPVEQQKRYIGILVQVRWGLQYYTRQPSVKLVYKNGSGGFSIKCPCQHRFFMFFILLRLHSFDAKLVLLNMYHRRYNSIALNPCFGCV